MSGFEVDPDHIAASGSKIGQFGERLAHGGKKLHDAGERLRAHAGRDKSGIGAALLKGFGRGVEITGTVFSEGGRVVGEAGKRLTATGHAYRRLDADNAARLNAVYGETPAAARGRPGRGRFGTAIASARGKARDFARSAKSKLGFAVGDPVDPVTGEVVHHETDVYLPGALPLLLERVHLSGYRHGGWFGRTWVSTVDQRIEVDATGVCFVAADGMLLLYPHTGGLPIEGPPLRLTGGQQDGYTVTDPETGQDLHFAVTDPTNPGVLPLIAITDRHGNRIDLVRDETGALTEIRHSAGYRVAVSTEAGRITGLRLRGTPDIELTRYGYDPAGNLAEVIDESGLPLRFSYDAAGRMTGWTSRTGTHHYRFHYDEQGRCVRAEGTGGYLSGTFTYRAGTTLHIDSLGHQTTFEINEHGQVVRRTDALGHATAFAWDRNDRLLAETDPLGHTTRYQYDAAGNLTEVTHPDGTRAETQYSQENRPTTITAPDGTIWRQEFDTAGNLVARTGPTGATTRYHHDDRGYLTSATDELGGVTAVLCDPAGLPVAITDPDGRTTEYRRDGFGRVREITGPGGRTIRLQWTVAGRLAARTNPDGATERWTYDADGNQLGHIDPLGARTLVEYAGLDLAVAHTDPSGARTQLRYDTEQRLVSVTNPAGLDWRYDYDPAGNLAAQTDFTGRTIRYTRDATGRVIAWTNAVGQTVTLDRDPLGRVVARHTAEGATTYAYDPAGRLIRAADADTELLLTRDPAGRVLAEASNGQVVRSAYDQLGRRLLRTTPSGLETRWEHDAVGRISALRAGGHTLTFDYDPAGREIARRLGGITLAQSWDAADRLRGQALTVPEARGTRLALRRSYTHRPDGAVTAILDQLDEYEQFDLDPLGRVTAVRGTRHQESYNYGPGGEIVDGSRTYDGTLIRTAGAIRYEHDAAGRRTARHSRTPSGRRRTWRYAWNSLDQLTEATSPEGVTWRYTYDPLGRRTAKVQVGRDGQVAERTDFTWDGTTLAEQRHSTGATTTWSYEPGDPTPLTQIDEQFHAIVTDAVGTPTELVDAEGRVTWSRATTLWGTPLGTDGAAACPLGFPGQYRDAETGLDYNYLRYADPETARFLSPDPLGLAAAPDPHGPVPNPLSWRDPLGLSPHGKPVTSYAGVDFHTPPGKSYFWTGYTKGVGGEKFGGEKFARAYARHRGGTTLEGFLDDHGIKMPDWQDDDPDSDQKWKDVSSAFSWGASGEVHVLMGEERRAKNVFEEDELPILRKNTNVTRVVAIDPYTGAHTEIFRRRRR